MNSMQTEFSGSDSDRNSDELHDEFPMGQNQSPDITSEDVASAEDVDEIVRSLEVTSNLRHNVKYSALEKDQNEANDDATNINDRDLTYGLRNISEKLSAALVNVSGKEDLVNLHAEVAEEAIAGWEKAEKEVAGLKKQLEALSLRNSALDDRVAHLDAALKECVRQLRQVREEKEQNFHDAVETKTRDLESAKIELQSKLIELQSKLEASNARSQSIDLEMLHKIEILEKENMKLKHELQAQSEELEIRTIERDLSTQAAEIASKQHLESISKVAKLEAKCRRLKSTACKGSAVSDHKSITSSSFCVESLTDSQSDNGERLNAAEIDACRKSGSETDKCEPSSDSWAAALIAELDQFKNDKCGQIPSSAIKIDLMDDFLEMERFAAMPEITTENFNQESVVTDQSTNGEISLADEFDTMNRQMKELKEKLDKANVDKSELEIALMKCQEQFEASQLRLREADTKLKELQRELENANESEQMIENQLASMEAEAQSITKRVQLLEAEVDREQAMSDEITIKCKVLEEELESKKQNEKLLFSDLKIKQEDLALAAGKLADCQQTIAALGNQLNCLAALENFKLYSNDT
ncbi:Filament-like plant protein [Arachis hypogaea]|nr:Filament-like plant protein [Arachis hypogaea]